jgi:hypothetical protein
MNWLEAQPNKHPRTASRIVDGEAVIVLPEMISPYIEIAEQGIRCLTAIP